MTDSVNSVTSADNTQYTATRTTGVMGKDDFLRLLTTQLENQDPLNPASEQEMVGTLAQFTALEQTGKLADSMDALTKTNQWSHGEGLLGRAVLGTDVTGALVQGTVLGLRMDGGNLMLNLDGAAEMPIANLMEVLA